MQHRKIPCIVYPGDLQGLSGRGPDRLLPRLHPCRVGIGSKSGGAEGSVGDGQVALKRATGGIGSANLSDLPSMHFVYLWAVAGLPGGR